MLKLLCRYSGTDYPFTDDDLNVLETRRDITPLDSGGPRGIHMEWTVYMMASHGVAGEAASAADPSPPSVPGQDLSDGYPL